MGFAWVIPSCVLSLIGIAIGIRTKTTVEIELKIRKATTVALTFSFNKLLTPNFDDVPDDSKNSL